MEKIQMNVYLDSNVFVYALAGKDESRQAAIDLISFLKQNKFKAVTSLLTFDEIVKVIRRHIGKEESIESGQMFLNMENLRRVDVTEAIIYSSLETMKQFNLFPRDSIHFATARLHGINIIVSEDKDFDNIEGIERLSISKFIAIISKSQPS